MAEDSSSPSGEKLNTRAAGIISLAVMCSRLLGLAREQIFAALFGGGRAMDAFTVAFRTPNLLRDLFAEGALSTAFVTTFSRTIARQGDEAAWRLANKVGTLTAMFLTVLALLGMLIAPWLVALFAPGFDPEKAALTVTLARVMYPFIVLVSLAALVMGLLNAKNVFGMPAMASSFFNLGSIAGGVILGYWLDPHFGPLALVGLAIGTLIGGALQLGVQLPRLHRLGFRYRPDFQWRDSGVVAVLFFAGRTHYYEGRGVEAVVHGVRTAAAAGCQAIVLTNGCGGLNPEWAPGTPVIIDDHINLTGRTPLVGANFVDMTQTYSRRLRDIALSVDPDLDGGVYAQFPGPQYETPAEVRMAGILGADLVGMSTVLEAIAARAAGLEILGLSLVTNAAAGMTGEALHHAEVLQAGQDAGARLATMLSQILERM